MSNSGWKPSAEMFTACTNIGVHVLSICAILHYADERIEIKAINSFNEKLLFVRRHISHDIQPICSTFTPENGIVDGLNVSNGMLMHTAQSFHEFHLIACDLAIVSNCKPETNRILYHRYTAYASTISSIDSIFTTFNEITFHFA